MGIAICEDSCNDLTNLSYEFSNWIFEKEHEKADQIDFD